MFQASPGIALSQSSTPGYGEVVSRAAWRIAPWRTPTPMRTALQSHHGPKLVDVGATEIHSDIANKTAKVDRRDDLSETLVSRQVVSHLLRHVWRDAGLVGGDNAHMYICSHIHTHRHLHVYALVCASWTVVCTQTCLYIYTHRYICIHTLLRAFLLSVCLRVYLYMCTRMHEDMSCTHQLSMEP